MESLEIRADGTFTLPRGSVTEFIRYLEGHGVRCDPTGMTASDRSHATVPQGHIHQPFDAARVQELYREWRQGQGE